MDASRMIIFILTNEKVKGCQQYLNTPAGFYTVDDIGGGKQKRP
jgi:hypothetical protein